MPRILSVVFVLACAVGVVGCSDSRRGGYTTPNAANLTVENRSFRTLHVYIDGFEIGDVQPGTTGFFHVQRGFGELAFRERGEAFLDYQGDFFFDYDRVLDVIYDPGNSFNFRVENTSSADIHVWLGPNDIGVVEPGAGSLFLVNPGTFDVYFSAGGSTTTTYYGDYTFSSGNVIEVVYIP